MQLTDLAPAWRRHPVVVDSPLSPRAALAQLRAGRTGTLGMIARSLDAVCKDHAVVGHISGERIQLTALQPGLPNLWRPILLGRVVPTTDGSAVVGEFGWRPAVGALSVIWVAAIVLLAVFGLLDAIVAVLATHWQAASNAGLVVLIAAGMGLVLLRLVAVTARQGQADERYLRNWLVERLDVPRRKPARSPQPVAAYGTGSSTVRGYGNMRPHGAERYHPERPYLPERQYVPAPERQYILQRDYVLVPERQYVPARLAQRQYSDDNPALAALRRGPYVDERPPPDERRYASERPYGSDRPHGSEAPRYQPGRDVGDAAATARHPAWRGQLERARPRRPTADVSYGFAVREDPRPARYEGPTAYPRWPSPG